MAIDPQSEDVLAQDDPQLLADIESDDGPSEADYPQPELGDVQLFLESTKPGFQPLQDAIVEERTRRYQLKTLPPKWQSELEDGRPVFTRRTHNELLHVVGLQTDSPLQVEIKAAADTEKAREAARKEQRWANQLMPAFERAQPTGRPLRRRFDDAQNEDGLVAWEVYLTGTYDDVIDVNPKTFVDPKTGVPREETAPEIQKRNDAALIGKKLPFGIRMVDGMCLYFEEDGEEICRAAVVEFKPYKVVYSKQKQRARKKARADGVAKWKDAEPNIPKPGTPGWPSGGGSFFSGTMQDTTTTTRDGSTVRWSGMPVDGVETIRYYDPIWYAYIVGGRFVEGPVRHGLGQVPIFPCWGLTTSSPNIGESALGICAGMGSIETAMDDALTLLADLHYTYSRPKLVIETESAGKTIPTSPTDMTPQVLDLRQPGVVQLLPGQKLVNALQGWEPHVAVLPQYLAMLQGMWQVNGINPVAQGEAPSAAASGYQVNLLTTSAQSPYQDCLANEATTWGRVIDFVRHLIRDVIKEAVPLACPGDGKKKGTIEWLTLRPEDISESPAIVRIEGMNEANKAQKAQWLSQGNKEGYISRARVQMGGYGVEDVDAEDDQIALDIADQQLIAFDIQQVQARILNGGMQGQQGGPPPQDPGAPPAGAPAPQGPGGPPPAPPIGAELAAASQAPSDSASTVASMRAGQGARPPIRPGAGP